MQKYDVAAYIWPAYTGSEPRTRLFWPDGIGEWQTVKAAGPKFDGHQWPRKPLWGYVDEADPIVMEKQIDEALSHNVNVFIYDWYWFENRPFLEQCLNNGFLNAKNNNKMKFYLMWANHNANYTWDIRNSSDQKTEIWTGKVSEQCFKEIGVRWIEKYFMLPNYYTINGKPVISIYDIQNFIDGIGGIEKAARAVDYLQNEAIRRGLPGIHFQFIKWGRLSLNLSGVDSGITDTPVQLIKRLGFESLTHYQFVHFMNIDNDYEAVLPKLKDEWDGILKDYDIPYCPHVSIGWDNNPRFKRLCANILKNNTPEQFEKALKMAKEYIDKNNTVPLVTINSWNEWTEGSYLEPDDLNGYGYLDAVKRVFGEQ